MIIDFTAHIYSNSILKIIKSLPLSKDFAPGKWYTFDSSYPENRLKLMKKYGIDMQVLSLAPPLLAGLAPKRAAKIARDYNDDIRDICEKYPEKFRGLASISLTDQGSAVDELDRAINDLGLSGVMVATQQDGLPIDSRQNDRLLSRLEKYDVPIFLHPMSWGSYKLAEEYRVMHVFGWPFDTTVAIGRLIFSGALDRHPKLKVVTHHLGAGLPFLEGRVHTTYRIHFQKELKKKPNDYFKMFYGDTALDGGKEALSCGFEFFGPDRIVFGTDYPFGPEGGESFLRDSLRGVLEMKISRIDSDKILSGNAKKLLKIS